MAQDPKRHRIGHTFDLPPRWRWICWPIIVLSGGVTALALLLEEEAIALVDCAPIAALVGMAALLYYFNYCVFKAVTPRPEDLETPSTDHNSLVKKD